MNLISEKFCDISYLRSGNLRQRYCWSVLADNEVFEKLSGYDPVLAGTIPIGIDIDSSDLDIVCRSPDPQAFSADMERLFGREEEFRTWYNEAKNAMICQFRLGGTLIELYGGKGDPCESSAFRHMIVEERLLRLGGGKFRAAIVGLKESGVKTEPAFAMLLGLPGDPYEAMLELADMTDDELGLLVGRDCF